MLPEAVPAAPWASQATRRRLAEIQAAAPNPEAERALVSAALDRHHDAMERAGVVLYAGTNAALIRDDVLQLGMRPSLGPAGEKLQTGLDDLELVEVLTARAVAATVGASWADVRLQSATLANLAAYTVLAPLGSTIASLPAWAGGHVSHHAAGAPAIRGHRVVELPYDSRTYDVDVDALPAFLARERPALVVVGGSLVLFPNRLPAIAATARRVGARVLYDASHTVGLIAAGRFQDPLREGADAITFSTYKSYGGPAGGAVAAVDLGLAERLERAVYPRLTSNYDAGRLPALHAAAWELLENAPPYAAACVALAQALGGALASSGLPPIAGERGWTESHHLAVPVDAPAAAARRLAAAGIYVSATLAPGPSAPLPALRIGTQELARRGFGVERMAELAHHVAAVILHDRPPADVRRAVIGLRDRVTRTSSSPQPRGDRQ